MAVSREDSSSSDDCAAGEVADVVGEGDKVEVDFEESSLGSAAARSAASC